MSGYKDFVAGDPLTAAQVDGYLMRQSVMVFASATARNAALSGVLVEGMHAYCVDLGITGSPAGLTVYDGSAWVIQWSEWAAYTPAWTALTVGNGTYANCKYRYLAGSIEVHGKLTFGSTTSISGVVFQTVPDSASIDSPEKMPLGHVLLSDITGSNVPGRALGYTATTVWFIGEFSTGSAPNYINSTTATLPFTWATGDIVYWNYSAPLA